MVLVPDRSRRRRPPTRPGFHPKNTLEVQPPRHPLGTPNGLDPNSGLLASAAWLAASGLEPPGKTWDVEVALGVASESGTCRFDDAEASRLHLFIYAEEWGFKFVHDGRCSWIRVTDIPFAHGRDDYQLLALTPPLKYIRDLICELENRYSLRFRWDHAAIRTTIPNAERAIRRWLLELCRR